MMEFYLLISKTNETDRGSPTYGEAGWVKSFPRAEWHPTRGAGHKKVVCPEYEGHQRPGGRIGDLAVEFRGSRFGDFLWTCYSECLVRDSVVTALGANEVTGFDLRPAIVEVARDREHGSQVEIPRYRELVVTGRGGEADPRSGIRLIYTCKSCGLMEYSSYTNGLFVDTRHWDGSDMFTLDGFSKLILVTPKVKDIIMQSNFTNCFLIPAENVRWPRLVIRPEKMYPPGGGT